MTIAYVLAGGLGTRLRKEISDVPKPMAPVNGSPFLKLLLNFWIKKGVTKFIISVGYLKNHIKNYFGKKYMGVPIEYFEENHPLGTGGALLIISKKINEDFLVINGDTYFDVSLEKLKKFKSKLNCGIVMSLFENTKIGRYGQVIIDELNWVKRIKKSKKKLSNFANGGVYLMDPSIIINNISKFERKCSLEKDILPYLISKKQIAAAVMEKAKFIDIGVPSDYIRASEYLKI